MPKELSYIMSLNPLETLMSYYFHSMKKNMK